jgi:hypothetical protein
MLIGTEDKTNMSFSQMKLDYNYPEGLDLHPDSALHQRLLQRILEDVKGSYEEISKRFPIWRELDEKLTVYIDLEAEEQQVQSQDKSKPSGIVIPITYATRESLLTYWSAAFLQHPLFRYKPSNDPADLLGTILLEGVINQDCINSKAGLVLYTMWSDAFTYGFGAVSPSWKTRKGYRTRYLEEDELTLGFPTGKRVIKSREEVITYDGSSLISLDPYNCLPDMNQPIQNVQDMDFFGWSERLTYNSLLSDERVMEGEIFNVKYLQAISSKHSKYFSATEVDTGRYTKSGINVNARDTRYVDLINIYRWIIPKDLELGSSEYPELWRFVLAADRVIIEARPLNLDHNEIPVATMAPGSDGHTVLPVSILEREYPIQHGLDWLWKSRIINVRKSMNNLFVVDPSLINMNDLTDTRYGMVARLRAAAWGRGTQGALEAINVPDVTQSHIQDMGFLMNIDNLVFTSTQAKGAQERKGERVSATEARDTRTSFLSKMEKDAKLGSMQAHFTIAKQLAYNTVQLMTQTKYVEMTGEYAQILQEEYGIQPDMVKVDPRALDIRFDVVSQDGSLPGGEFGDVWERLMTNAASHKELYERIDFTRVWLHIARLLGAKNASEFLKKQPVVAGQGQIDKQVQAGNMIPAQGFGGV